MVHLGWKPGPEQYAPSELLRYACLAERAGFDGLDASDHFHPWSEAGQASFVWTWLGAAAVKTERMLLGSGVTCPILRYHPAVIAQAAATVSSMASGRFFLGVGTGEALNEYAAVGEWPGYRERQERLAEAVDLMRRLLSSEEPLSFEGKFYKTRKAKLYTPPAKPVPIYVSSLVPESAAFAGRTGDGLITVGGKSPDAYQRILAAFESGARAAGRDPAKMPRMIELFVAYPDDSDPAIESIRKYWAGAFVPAMYDQKIYTPAMSEQNGAIVEADAIRKAAVISRDPESHVRSARRYIELGFTHLFFHSAGPDQQAFLDGYGRDVLPRLRSLS
jgi:coenzyme F420-dependent glucose-6-phosphate dehydrogenase